MTRNAVFLALIALIIGFGGGLWFQKDGGGAVSEKKQLWTCGMHPQVIQDKPGTCPICGMALEPMRDGPAAAQSTQPAERKIKYWWDPMMNPPYVSDRPGKSPMGMDLVPVYDDEVSGGSAVQIDPVVIQNMGVRTSVVTQGPLEQTIHTVGYLNWAEPNIHDVNLRISGWVEKLYSDTEGMSIEKGQPLFNLYSPELQVAVEELISARRALRSGEGQGRGVSQALYDAARRKLEQWGLEPAQIEQLSKLERAPRAVTFISPASGELTEKNLVAGSAVMVGQRALRIVDRSTLWLDAEVYAMDLPLIKAGQKAHAEVEGIPGKEFGGEIIFIDPRIDPSTRTAKVRVILPNKELLLRPGMFATVAIRVPVFDRALTVPREAVLDTGVRQIVFVALPGGHFEPRNVKLGIAGEGGMVQVLSGLAPGDLVVTSGQFLLDSESRMKEAIQKHLAGGLLARGEPRESAQLQAESKAAEHPASARFRAALDEVVKEYLKLSEFFGRVAADDHPADVTSLLARTEQLSLAAELQGEKERADELLKAVRPLSGASQDEQRSGFKTASSALVKLLDVWPPTKAAAGEDAKLYLLYCPMAQGYWLQDSDQRAANPYYAKSMKACAEQKRTIEAAPSN